MKNKLETFHSLVEDARTKCGDSAPRVTDAVIQAAFPETWKAATTEAADRMFRDGVKTAVANLIRKPGTDERQRTFSDIAPGILPLAEQLGSVAYFVPDDSGVFGEYVSVPDLCFDADRLEKAQRFMVKKGEECLAEADLLAKLHEAVTAAAPESLLQSD